MAKGKKIKQEDLKKFFEKAKKKLHELREETGIWIKKGEAELSRISKIGRLEFDIVSLNVKKERLLKDIGKRVVELGLDKGVGDTAFKNICDKVHSIMEESRKKKAEISRIKKKILKSKATKEK